MISVGQRRCRGDRACGEACQAGEARARAASASRTAAIPQIWAAGQADAMAKLMRRTLMRTRAPTLSNLSRMVPAKVIKECQLDLYADRTSTATMRANQVRLWFPSMAYH